MECNYKSEKGKSKMTMNISITFACSDIAYT